MSRSSLPSVDGARTGLIQITVGGLLWGTTGVVVQYLHQHTGLSPVAIGFYRLAVAAVALFVLLPRLLRDVTAAVRSAPLLMLVIGIGLGVYQALYFYAVAAAGIAIATVVSIGLAPVTIALWEALRSGRMPARHTLLSVAAAIAGLTLITGFQSGPTGAAPQPLWGLLAAMGAGLGYAATTIVSRHVSQSVAPLTMTASATAIGAVTLLPLALTTGGIDFAVSPIPVGLLIYLGVIATAVAYALFYAGLRTTSGTAAVILTLLEPLAAALLAVVLLSEPLSVPVVAGGALLLGAILMTHVRPAPAPIAP
jgi:DME family drug/metabolite transporter